MLLKLQFIFKMFALTLEIKNLLNNHSEKESKIIKGQMINSNLSTEVLVKCFLTLKNAAVEPPWTAPYLIFCCLKCSDLKFKVQFIRHKNSDFIQHPHEKFLANLRENESGLLFFLNSSGNSDRVAQWRPICWDGGANIFAKS